MRNAWRSLLIRRLSPCPTHIQNNSQPLIYLPAIRSRFLSSEPAADPKDGDLANLVDSLKKPIGRDVVAAELESAAVAFDHETVNSLLRQLRSAPDSAREVFIWVLNKDVKKLSSKSYNIMLQILGCSGKTNEFWKLVDGMKKMGYGISRTTYTKVYDSFEKDGLQSDLSMLKEIDFSNSPANVVGRTCSRVCKILSQKDELDGEVRRSLKELGLKLSTDLVVAVLEQVGTDPKKALMFMRWVEENRGFKIDAMVYNALARVLGREGWIGEFQGVINRMRDGGHEMEMETYGKVSDRFLRRKMLGEAVDLYDFAMGGSEKPSKEDFALLLKKIVVNKDLDLTLISKVVGSYINGPYPVKGYVVDSLIKSLTSVNRLPDYDKVLKAMEEGGFVADDAVHDRVVVRLCVAGKSDEALKHLINRTKSGQSPGMKAWRSLLQTHSVSGELDKAVSYFHQMVETRGSDDVGGAFEVLVSGFCQNNKVMDVIKILKEMVTKKNLRLWQGTYKLLIEKLIGQGSVKEASTLLGLMKINGYPPYVEPFISFMSKSGSVDDAITFLKAITVKEFPSKVIFLRIFEGLLKEGRHQVAQDLLSRSPGSVRNHADVLELFYSMRPDESAVGAAV